MKTNEERLEGLSLEQKRLINNVEPMSHPDPTKTYDDEQIEEVYDEETHKDFQKVADFTAKDMKKEMDQISIDHNKLLLEQAIKISRTEPFGYSIEEMADVITDSLAQAESQSLIDKLVIFHGKKFGERLFR